MKKSIVLIICFFTLNIFAAERQTKSSDGVSIHYSKQGQGKPALVFIHGWCANRTYWSKQMDYFSDTMTVITLDLAGHGDSGKEREMWSLGTFADDVVAVVEQENLKNVILIGHSMGGAIMLEAAQKIQDRVTCLVGIDALIDLSVSVPDEQISGLVGALKGNYQQVAPQIVATFFTPETPEEVKQRVNQDVLSTDGELAAEILGAGMRFKPSPDYRKFNIPVFAINAQRIPTNVDAAQSFFSSFELKPVTGAGHYVMLEQPDRVNSLIQEIILNLKE